MRNHLITLLVVVIAGVLCATSASAVPVEFAVTGSYGVGLGSHACGWWGGGTFAGRIYGDLDMADPYSPTLTFVDSDLVVTSGYYEQWNDWWDYDPETDTWSFHPVMIGYGDLTGQSVLFSSQTIYWDGTWWYYDPHFDLQCPTPGGGMGLPFSDYVEFTTPTSWSLSPPEGLKLFQGAFSAYFFIPMWNGGADASLTGSQVPEPGTLSLIAPALLGFAGLAFRRMRRS